MNQTPALPGAPNAQTGLTLLELIVTLVVGGILMAIAAPAFNDLRRNLALDAAADRLYDDLHAARNHAVTHGVRVTLCARDGDQCGDSDEDWANGWLVFEESVEENTRRDPGERLVLERRGDADHVRLSFHKLNPFVFYKHTGLGWPNATFRFCSATDGEDGESVVIGPSGRPRFARPGDDPVKCADPR